MINFQTLKKAINRANEIETITRRQQMELKVKSIKIKDMNHLAKLVTEMDEGFSQNEDIAEVKKILNKVTVLQSYNFRAVAKVMHKTAAEYRTKRLKAKKK